MRVVHAAKMAAFSIMLQRGAGQEALVLTAVLDDVPVNPASF